MDLITDRFTIGVFRDVPSAEAGIEALARHGFAASTLSVIAKATPEVEALVQRVFGVNPPAPIEVGNLGPAILHGQLIGVLDTERRELSTRGLSGTARRAGFQAHDCVIFERLVARGGVLVAISSEARSSDALATLHAFGGGNAAIGAWTGRV